MGWDAKAPSFVENGSIQLFSKEMSTVTRAGLIILHPHQQQSTLEEQDRLLTGSLSEPYNPK